MRLSTSIHDWETYLTVYITVFSALALHSTASPTNPFSLRKRTPTTPQNLRQRQTASSRGPLLPATPFYLFPTPQQPENILPRNSGQILVTVNTPSALLYQIDPTRNQTGGIIHDFLGYTSLFGIVEPTHDIFYLIAGNFTGPPDYYGIGNSYSILELDLRGIADPAASPDLISQRITHIVDIPTAELLDGLAVVNAAQRLLVTGDAQLGTLYLIDIHARTATAVYADLSMTGTTTGRAGRLAHIGINGIKYRDGNLYFTNTAKNTYLSLPLSKSTGRPIAPATVLADYGTYTDDLNFDFQGNAFISLPLEGIELRLASEMAGSKGTRLISMLPGANSNAFGRSLGDSCVLYSTFNGNPGGVARVDVGREGFCGESSGFRRGRVIS